MISFKKPSLVRALLVGILLVAPLALTACGGGSGGDSVVARTKRLTGKVYAKLIGDKIGQLNANIKEINGVFEMRGTLDIDGTSFDINSSVDPENNFYVTFANTSPSISGGATVLADGGFKGKVAAPLSATPDTNSIINGVWTANLPTAGGRPGVTTFYKGTSDPTATVTSTGTGTSTRTTHVLLIGTSNKEVTNVLISSDGIGAVCGKPLYFAGLSATTNTRTFGCDGNGTYVDDTPPPNNHGSFVWGYAVSDTNKSQLQIKSFSEWGFGSSNELAALIYFRFTSGPESGESYAGIIGISGGKVLQGFGYGYQSR